MLSCATETETVVGALRAGAVGWVPKDLPVQQLMDVLRQVRAGAAWLPGLMLRGVLDEFLRDRSEQDRELELLDRLSVRERQVLRELAAGHDVPSIAERLFLSQNTVRTHIQNILGKLEVHSRVAAVALVHGSLGRAGRVSAQPEAGRMTAAPPTCGGRDRGVRRGQADAGGPRGCRPGAAVGVAHHRPRGRRVRGRVRAAASAPGTRSRSAPARPASSLRCGPSDCRPGARVLVPAVTFCGALHAIVHAGLTPVLVDVDPTTAMPTPDDDRGRARAGRAGRPR